MFWILGRKYVHKWLIIWLWEAQDGTNKVGTALSLVNKHFANPMLNSARFEKQSSVKWQGHNKRLELYCCGVTVKINCNHWLFTYLSFGSTCKVIFTFAVQRTASSRYDDNTNQTLPGHSYSFWGQVKVHIVHRQPKKTIGRNYANL